MNIKDIIIKQPTIEEIEKIEEYTKKINEIKEKLLEIKENV